MKALPVDIGMDQYFTYKKRIFKKPKTLMQTKNVNDLSFLVVSNALSLSDPLFKLGVNIIQSSKPESSDFFIDIVMGKLDQHLLNATCAKWFIWLDVLEFLDRQSSPQFQDSVSTLVPVIVQGVCNDRGRLSIDQQRDILLRVSGAASSLSSPSWHLIASELLFAMPRLAMECHGYLVDRASNVFQQDETKITQEEHQYLNAWCYAELVTQSRSSPIEVVLSHKYMQSCENVYIKIYFMKNNGLSTIEEDSINADSGIAKPVCAEEETLLSKLILGVKLSHFHDEGSRLISVLGNLHNIGSLSHAAQKHLLAGLQKALNPPFDMRHPDCSLALLVRCLSWINESSYEQALDEIYSQILVRWLNYSDRLSILFQGLSETQIGDHETNIKIWNRFGQQLSVSEVLLFFSSHDEINICPKVFVTFLMSCNNFKQLCKDPALLQWLQEYYVVYQEVLLNKQGSIKQYEVEAMCVYAYVCKALQRKGGNTKLMAGAKEMVNKLYNHIAAKPDIAIYPELKMLFVFAGLNHAHLVDDDEIQQKLSFNRVIAWLRIVSEAELSEASSQQVLSYLSQSIAHISEKLMSGMYLQSYHNIGLVIDIYELLVKIPKQMRRDEFEDILKHFDQIIDIQINQRNRWKHSDFLSYGMDPAAYELLKNRSDQWSVGSIGFNCYFFCDVTLIKYFLLKALFKAIEVKQGGPLISEDLDEILIEADRRRDCLSLMSNVIDSDDCFTIICLFQHLRRLVDTNKISKAVLQAPSIMEKQVSFKQDVIIGLRSEILLSAPMTITKQRKKDLRRMADQFDQHVESALGEKVNIDAFEVFSFGSLLLIANSYQDRSDLYFSILVQGLSENALRPEMAYIMEFTILPKFAPYLDLVNKMDRVTAPIESFLEGDVHWPLWQEFKDRLPKINQFDVVQVKDMLGAGKEMEVASQLENQLHQFEQKQTASKLSQLQKWVDGGNQSVCKLILDYIQGRLTNKPSVTFLEKIKKLVQCEFLKDFEQLSIWARWAIFLPLALITYLDEASSQLKVSSMIKTLSNSWSIWQKNEVVDFLELQIAPRLHKTLQSMNPESRREHLEVLKTLKLRKKERLPKMHALIRGRIQSVV